MSRRQVGSIHHHLLTRETLHLARDQIRRLEDRRRRVVLEAEEEIQRIRKMITDAGLEP
jgi:hypothetical protein